MGKTKCQLCLCITHQGFRFLRPTPLPSVSPPPFSLTHSFPACVCVCWCDYCSERHICMSSSHQLLLDQPSLFTTPVPDCSTPYGDYVRAQLFSFLALSCYAFMCCCSSVFASCSFFPSFMRRTLTVSPLSWQLHLITRDFHLIASRPLNLPTCSRLSLCPHLLL